MRKLRKNKNKNIWQLIIPDVWMQYVLYTWYHFIIISRLISFVLFITCYARWILYKYIHFIKINVNSSLYINYEQEDNTKINDLMHTFFKIYHTLLF